MGGSRRTPGLKTVRTFGMGKALEGGGEGEWACWAGYSERSLKQIVVIPKRGEKQNRKKERAKK